MSEETKKISEAGDAVKTFVTPKSPVKPPTEPPKQPEKQPEKTPPPPPPKKQSS